VSERDNAALFEPNMFERIERSFDLAIEALQNRSVAMTDNERTVLASRIMDAALGGDRIPQHICDAVLADLWPEAVAQTNPLTSKEPRTPPLLAAGAASFRALAAELRRVSAVVKGEDNRLVLVTAAEACERLSSA